MPGGDEETLQGLPCSAPPPRLGCVSQGPCRTPPTPERTSFLRKHVSGLNQVVRCPDGDFLSIHCVPGPGLEIT